MVKNSDFELSDAQAHERHETDLRSAREAIDRRVAEVEGEFQRERDRYRLLAQTRAEVEEQAPEGNQSSRSPSAGLIRPAHRRSRGGRMGMGCVPGKGTGRRPINFAEANPSASLKC